MSHTIKNLRDVEDSAPKFGFGELQEAHFAKNDLDTEQTGLSYMHIKPNQRQGFAHRHEKAEEIYVIIHGSGRVKIEDEIHPIKRLDAIRVAADQARSFEADGDGLEYIAFGARHDDDRGELITEGFWG
jgi:mannose-6-phosphate isomerase-like protein (cupin superfamily)